MCSYVSEVCCARRVTNSSLFISRTTHFDNRWAISVARTCLHCGWMDRPPVASRTKLYINRGCTHRDLRLRYQDGVGESWACAEERDGAGLMQAWENGVGACHPEDGKVASTPWGSVLDYCGKTHTHTARKGLLSLSFFPGRRRRETGAGMV